MNPHRRTFNRGVTGLGALAAGATVGLWPNSVLAQPASAAAEEAKAPPMPALGSVWKVPALDRFNAPRFEPSQAEGKMLLIYWWASTCPFCALQSPAMEAFWRAHQARGLQMLGISIDRKPEDAVAYLQKMGYTFPSGWATPAFKQAMPKPRGLPITLLRGRDGRLLLAEKGQMFAEDVEAMTQWL
jgi:hypothetical protein